MSGLDEFLAIMTAKRETIRHVSRLYHDFAQTGDRRSIDMLEECIRDINRAASDA